MRHENIYIKVPGLLALLFVALHGYAMAAGNTYYVSLSGDNDNDGLSETEAWRTITHACSEVQAGDTVIIKPGDYGNENAVVANSGTADEPIFIKAETPSARPRVSGRRER